MKTKITHLFIMLLAVFMLPSIINAQYCIPAPPTVDGNGITNISFGTVNNTTGKETGNYGDYSAMIGDGQQTTTLTVLITYSTSYTYGTKIWVDWNNDDDFQDTGEEVFYGTSTDNNPTVLSCSFTIPLTTSIGNHRMRIGGHDSQTPSPCSTGSWGCYEDYTINVTAAPNCFSPTNQTVTTITATGAKLNWTNGGATNFGIEYGPSGFTQGTGTYIGVTTDEFLTINSLSGGTSYDWYVKDSCSTTDVSAWEGPNTFITAYTPTYTEDFSTYVPANWSETQGRLKTVSSLSGTSSSWAVDGFGNNGSAGSARFNFDGINGDDWLISPSLDLSGGSYQLEFDIALTKYTGTDPEPFGADDSLAVVISIDGGISWSKANIIKLFTSSNQISNTGNHIIIDLSSYSTTVKIGFYSSTTIDDTDKNVYIDNFGIVTCPMASNQIESDLQAQQVQLNWTSGGASNYNIEYGPLGFVKGTGTTVNVSSDTFNILTNLTPEFDYDWYIQDNCGTGDLSAWNGPSSFTTTATCPAPTNQLESSITGSSVQLNWTSGGATNYGIEYGPSGFTQGTGTYIAVNADTFKIITGLTAITTYDWYVKDSCSTTDASYWTAVSSFTTDAPTQSLPFEDGFEADFSAWSISGNTTSVISHSPTHTGSNSANLLADTKSSNVELVVAFNSAFNPKMGFSYYIDQYNNNEFTVSILEANSSTWQVIHDFSTVYGGYYDGNKWLTVTDLNLAIYDTESGNFKIKISAVNTNSSYNKNVFLDDFYIFAPPQNDASITDANTVTLTGTHDILVEITNKGAFDLTSAQIYYAIDDNAPIGPFNWTGTLLPDAIVSDINIGSHSFTESDTNIYIWTAMPNGVTDEDTSNDTLKTSIDITTDAGILAIDESVILYGSSPVNAFIANFGSDVLLTSNIAWSVNDVLQTPATWSGSLTNGNADGPINLGNYNFVQGDNIVKIWTISPNGITATDDDDDTNDEIVKTFTFNVDAGISQIDLPTEPGTKDVVIYIENFDNIPLTSATINYEINAGTPVVYSWTGNIAPGTVGGPFTIGTGTFIYGSNTIVASTILPNGIADASASNDEITETFDITSDLALIDAGVTSTANCDRGNETVFIEIQNNSTTPITGPYNVKYQEGTSTIITEIIPSTETILPGANLVYNFNTLIDLTVSSDVSFDLKTWVVLTTDNNASNNTFETEVQSWVSPTVPTVTDGTTTYGNTTTIGATLTQGDQLNWYDSEVDGTLLENAATYTTPNLYDTTTYYVAAQSMGLFIQEQQFTKDNGSTSKYNSPSNGNYDNNWSRMIYLPSDLNIGLAAEITKIAFQKSNYNNYTQNNQKIYLMHTTDNTITSSAYIDPVTAGATLVYDGSISWNGYSSSWVEISLQTSFNYNNTDNLLVIYENRNGNYTSSYPTFKCSYATDRVAYKQQDNTFPATAGTIGDYLPNFRVSAKVPTPYPKCESNRIPVVANVTAIPSDAGITNINEVTEVGSQEIYVELSNSTSVVLTSIDIDYEVNGVAGTTYNWTGNLANNATEMVNIGTGNLVHGKDTIKAWSSLPNGSADPNALNDTTKIGFTIYSDLAVIDIQEPVGGCDLSTANVIAKISNIGDDTIHNYNMVYHIVGEPSVVTENIAIAIAPGETINYTFSTPVDLSTTTLKVFDIWIYTQYNSDSTTNNDSMFISVTSNIPPNDLLANNAIVPYGTSASLTSTSTSNISWYDAAVGGNLLATNNTLITPILYDTTSYFVEAVNGEPNVLITEIIQYSGGSGMTSPYPSWITEASADMDGMEISNLGGLDADLSGYTIHLEGGTTGDWTFPNGTILSAGELLIIDYRAATNHTNLSNNYFCLGKTWPIGSSAIIGYYLTNANGDIIDAVATNGRTFSAASGVTSAHWSGNIGSSSSKAGVSRYISDNNSASDWKVSFVDFPNQTFGTINPTLTISSLACTSTRIEVKAIVNNFPAKDAGIVRINTPNSGINNTNAELINVTVKNNGTIAIDTLPVHYSLDNATTVIDTVFVTLNPGDTANFTFTEAVDLSALTTYSLEVLTALTGDIITSNNTLIKTIEHDDYCISYATSTSDNDIGNITINHPISNIELLNNGIAFPVVSNVLANKTYSNFTSLTPINIEIGQAYPISISQIENGVNFYGSAIKVYIDYNQDGLFNDVTEMLFSGNSTSASNNMISGTLTIPQNALVGNTRMRVVLDESDVANPCGTYTWGETEDYTINIVDQVFANAGVNDTVCNTHSTTLAGSGLGDGLTYAWSTGDNTMSTTITPSTTTMYYITVNDTYGFTSIDSTEVFVRELPILSFPALAEMCVDASAITLNTATPSGGTYSGVGVSTGIFNPTTAGVGTHTLKYIYTNMYGCMDSITQTITINSLPTISFTTSPNVCYDAASFSLNVATSPTGGTYSGTGVAVGQFTAANAGAGSHYIKYEYTDGNGCYNIDSTIQTVDALPIVVASSTPDTIFWGTNTVLNAATGSSTYSYAWTPVDSLSASGQAMVQSPSTKSLFVPTTFNVLVTDQTTSCMNTDQVVVKVKGGPLSATPTIDLDTICAGDAIVLNAQASGGSESYSYAWTSNPAGYNSSDVNPSFNPTLSTTFTVVVNDGFNSATESIEVYAHTLPTAYTVMPTTAICLNDSVAMDIDLTGAAPYSLYTSNSLSGPSFASSAANKYAPYLQPSLDATFNIDSIVDANGCMNTSTAQTVISINDLPTVAYTGSDTICIGTTTTATATFTGASPFDYVYNGMAVNGISTMTDDQSIAPTTDSMFIVTKVTDGNGCISMGNLDSIYIMVNSLPTAIASDNDSICIGDSTMISINFTGVAPYTFNVWNGVAMMNNISSTTDLFTAYNNSTVTTTYTIKSITDNNGCTFTSDIDSLEIFVNALPTPTFTGLATDYCEDAAVVTLIGLPTGGTFTGIGITGNDFDPSTANSGNNDINYHYTDANGCENSVINSTVINTLPNISITGLANDYCVDAADVNLTATPTGTGGVWTGSATSTGDFSPATNGAGTHTVYYTFTDANTCVNSDSATTIVNALPIITLTTLADVCDEANSFMITGASPAGGDWSGNSVSNNYFNATNSGAGSYYLTYTVTDANGCVNMDSTMQLVNPLPVLNITGFDADYCANASTDTLDATPAGGTFFGMGMTANVFDPSVVNAGSVSILYMYTDANGCFNSTPATTTVNSIPMVDLGSDKTVCEYSSSMLDAGNAGDTYIWNTGATTQSIVLDTNGNGIGDFMYNVTVTNANSCSNMDSVEITYEATPVSQLTDTNTICGEDANITLDAGYISGNTYVWSNGVSWSSITVSSTDLGGTMGNMSVEITSDGGCVFNDTTFVYFREIPVVDLGGDEIVCVNHEFTIDAGAGFASYLWNTGATTQSITIDSNTFDVGHNLIKVEVYNDANCNAMDSMILVVDPCTGIKMPELSNANINIYPNPSTGLFQIDVDGLENEEYNLDIYNSVGAVVYSDKVSNNGNSKQTWKLDFSTYAKGVYYVRLHSNGDIKVKRIVIQ